VSDADNTAKDFQVIVIGGGPAGLTAGLYTSRARLNTLLLEKAVPGGQITMAENVENFPGFPKGISGWDLGVAMQQQALQYGVKTLTAEVTGLTLEGKLKSVKTTEGNFRAPVVILAGGSERGKLGVPGEERLLGRGVSVCATCDGAFFTNERVAVVGGGNAAVSEALSLTRHASRVFLIHRRNQLRATKVVQERLFAEPKIEIVWDTVVEEVVGEEKVEELKLKNVRNGKTSSLPVAAVFVATGLRPSTEYLKGLVDLDEQGHIVVNDMMETSVAGILAAGDIRHNSIKQCIAAAGDGAIAAMTAERLITEGR